MKTIKTTWFPFGKFNAINLFGIVFYKGKLSERTINHEAIHTAQMQEMLYIGFYLWYFLEWLYQAVVWLFNKKMRAYRFITFEQEANEYETNKTYTNTRTRYAWTKYLGEWREY